MFVDWFLNFLILCVTIYMSPLFSAMSRTIIIISFNFILSFLNTHHFSSPLKGFSFLDFLLSTCRSFYFKHRSTFILTPHLHFDFELPLTFGFIAVSSSSSLQIVLRYQDF